MSYLRASNREHEALVDAIERHDPTAAVAVIEAHIQTSSTGGLITSLISIRMSGPPIVVADPQHGRL
jgi:hypothetical protein